MKSEVAPRLQALFARELSPEQSHQIVFWYDDAAEYVNEIDNLQLDGVRVLRGDDHHFFQIKYELEEIATAEHVLLYFPYPQPEIYEDWLRDVYEYSLEFKMDEIALLMADLGLEDMHVRAAFDQYSLFFRARERRIIFRQVARRLAVCDEDSLDLAIFTALTKAPVPEFFTIVKHLFSAESEESNKPWMQLVRFGREDIFWQWTKRYFGYPLKAETPSLEHFLASVLATHATDELGISVLVDTVTEVDPINSEVLINQWQNDPHYQASYRKLAKQYEERLDVASWLTHLPEETVIYADTFPVFDERIIRYLMNRFIEGGQDFVRYENWLSARRTTKWYDQYKPVYQVLQAAFTLKSGIGKLDQDGLAYEAKPLFDYYCTEGYRFDTAYRHFYSAYDRIQSDIEELEVVKEQVENLYVHFLAKLDYKWSNILEGHQQLQLDSVSKQADFYDHFVKPLTQNRVFVIISDAFRYELARELTDRLNSQRRFSSDLQAMSGMIPSYTALGMAALLPHKELTFEKGKVLADGNPTQGTKARGDVLAAKEPASLAMTYSELQALPRKQLREQLSGKKVVYIYHNQIDNLGESTPGEHHVFAAAQTAIAELEKLVNKLFTTVSAGHLLITADHGFIYTRDRLPESKRHPLAGLSGELENRRFIVNCNGENKPGTLTFALPAASEQPMYVHTPRGTTRFITRGGGEHYVHGGAMLQEITIPVLQIKTDRQGASLGDILVQIQLTSITRKLTNHVTHLDFLQRERVEGKFRPARYLAYFVDQDGLPVSNVVHILADATSNKPQERLFHEKFVLTQRAYNPDEDYDLLITYEDGTTYERIPFTIDIPWMRY